MARAGPGTTPEELSQLIAGSGQPGPTAGQQGIPENLFGGLQDSQQALSQPEPTSELSSLFANTLGIDPGFKRRSERSTFQQRLRRRRTP